MRTGLRCLLLLAALLAAVGCHGRGQLQLRALRQLRALPECDTQCQADQRQALTTMYQAWSGDTWLRRANWLRPDLPVCSWEGVHCCAPSDSPDWPDPTTTPTPTPTPTPTTTPTPTPTTTDSSIASADYPSSCSDPAQGVQALTLASNNVTGALSAVPWAALAASLQLLDLDSNQLTIGPPNSSSSSNSGGSSLTDAGLGALSQLAFLSAAGNALQGPLGDLGASLPRLGALVLPANQLTGTLPASLLTHPQLEYLDLATNRLGGPLPAALFTSQHRLRSVSLANNSLEGSFPQLPDNATLAGTLSTLNVAWNRLSGPLPRYLPGLRLEYLDVARNGLGGPVAPLLQAAWSLAVLQAAGNQLNGSLPEVFRARHLELLDLSSNALSGTLPASLAVARGLTALKLRNNSRLVGTLPAALGAIPGLDTLDVRDTGMQAEVAGQAGLPPFLTLHPNSAFPVLDQPGGPVCPAAFLHNASIAAVPPFYWQFAGCNCMSEYYPKYIYANASVNTSSSANTQQQQGSGGGRVVDMECLALPPERGGGPGGTVSPIPWWGIVVIVVGGLLVAAAALVGVHRLVPSIVKYRTLLAKRMPPGAGRTRGTVVTLVLTDVEGSTELWEWDTDLMAAAIDLHDHTLRTQMGRWFGYEVQTEGDAFLMAFHEAADAVGWCITTQLALLNAEWNVELFRHQKACIETVDSLQPKAPTAPHLQHPLPPHHDPHHDHQQHQALPSGSYATRPITAAGLFPSALGSQAPTQSCSQSHSVPQGQYTASLQAGLEPGTSVQIAGARNTAASALPAGIIVGDRQGWAASGISSAKNLTPLRHSGCGAEETATGNAVFVTSLGGGGGPGGYGGYRTVSGNHVHTSAGGAAGGGRGGAGGTGELDGGASLDFESRQLKFAQGVKHHDGRIGSSPGPEFGDWTRYTRHGVLFRGLRVRMGVATGLTDAITSHAITQRIEYTGEVYRRVQAVADLPSGGQVLLDSRTCNDIHNALNDLGVRVLQVLARDKRSLGGHPGALSLAARPGRSLSGMARGVGHRISLDLLRSHPRPRRSVELAHMREEAPQEEVQLPGQHHTLQQQQQLQPGSSGLGAGMVVVGSAEPGTGTGTDAGGSLTGDEEGSRHAGGKGRAVGRVGGSGGSPAGSGGGAGRENNSRLANWVRQSLANVHGPGTWLSGSPLRGGGGARGSRGGALQRQSTSQEALRSGNTSARATTSGAAAQHFRGLLSTAPHASGPAAIPTAVASGRGEHEGSTVETLTETPRSPAIATVSGRARAISLELVRQASGRSGGSGQMLSSQGVASGSLGTLPPGVAASAMAAAGVPGGPVAEATESLGPGPAEAEAAAMRTATAVAPVPLPAAAGGSGGEFLSNDLLGLSGGSLLRSGGGGGGSGGGDGAFGSVLPLGSTPSGRLQLSGHLAAVSQSRVLVVAPGGRAAEGQREPAAGAGGRGGGDGGSSGAPTGQLLVTGGGNSGPVGSASEADSSAVAYGRGAAEAAPGGQRQVKHLREIPRGPMAQAPPATAATVALNAAVREAVTRRASMVPAIAVVNMGMFELSSGGVVEYSNITQVLVPGLEERARLLPPLDPAHQLTPGYFNAPATMAAPLTAGWSGTNGPRPRCRIPPVTLVFCSMERFSEMVSVSRDLATDVMLAYNDTVRRSLLACGGYECQEQEGNYMIAFARPSDALEWCLMLQELLMEVSWSGAMLALPGMAEELHPLTGAVLFRGPRVKAGVYQGVPTRVGPHSTTGRADYFGPLVNRAARYCHAAAQGGQVIASRSLVEDVLRELLPPGAFAPADTRPALPPAIQQHQHQQHHNPHAAGAHSGPVGDTPPGTRTATGTGIVTVTGTAGRTGPTPALPLLLCAQLDNSTVEVPRWRMPADAGSSTAPSLAGATVDPTVYGNRVQEDLIGTSQMGSVMVVPEHPRWWAGTSPPVSHRALNTVSSASSQQQQPQQAPLPLPLQQQQQHEQPQASHMQQQYSMQQQQPQQQQPAGHRSGSGSINRVHPMSLGRGPGLGGGPGNPTSGLPSPPVWTAGGATGPTPAPSPPLRASTAAALSASAYPPGAGEGPQFGALSSPAQRHTWQREGQGGQEGGPDATSPSPSAAVLPTSAPVSLAEEEERRGEARGQSQSPPTPPAPLSSAEGAIRGVTEAGGQSDPGFRPGLDNNVYTPRGAYAPYGGPRGEPSFATGAHGGGGGHGGGGADGGEDGRGSTAGGAIRLSALLAQPSGREAGLGQWAAAPAVEAFRAAVTGSGPWGDGAGGHETSGRDSSRHTPDKVTFSGGREQGTNAGGAGPVGTEGAGGGGGADASGSGSFRGFEEVEVPLEDLVMYDIQPSSLPRKMRPAVEAAILEVKRTSYLQQQKWRRSHNSPASGRPAAAAGLYGSGSPYSSSGPNASRPQVGGNAQQQMAGAAAAAPAAQGGGQAGREGPGAAAWQQQDKYQQQQQQVQQQQQQQQQQQPRYSGSGTHGVLGTAIDPVQAAAELGAARSLPAWQQVQLSAPTDGRPSSGPATAFTVGPSRLVGQTSLDSVQERDSRDRNPSNPYPNGRTTTHTSGMASVPRPGTAGAAALGSGARPRISDSAANVAVPPAPAAVLSSQSSQRRRSLPSAGGYPNGASSGGAAQGPRGSSSGHEQQQLLQQGSFRGQGALGSASPVHPMLPVPPHAFRSTSRRFQAAVLLQQQQHQQQLQQLHPDYAAALREHMRQPSLPRVDSGKVDPSSSYPAAAPARTAHGYGPHGGYGASLSHAMSRVTGTGTWPLVPQATSALMTMDSLASREQSATFSTLWNLAIEEEMLSPTLTGHSDEHLLVNAGGPQQMAMQQQLLQQQNGVPGDGGWAGPGPAGAGYVGAGPQGAGPGRTASGRRQSVVDQQQGALGQRPAGGRTRRASLQLQLEGLGPGVHGVALPQLPEVCLRHRVGPFKWLWAQELVVEDLGQYRFKGVAGNHSIVSVSTAGTAERKLGSRVKKSKGERVEPGQGPLYRVLLQPANLNSLAQQNTALLQAAFAPSLGGGLPPGPGPDGEQSPPPGYGPHRPGQAQGMPGGLRGIGGISPPLASHRGHSSSRGPLSAPPLGSSGTAGPGLSASVTAPGGSYAGGSGDGGGGSSLGNGAGGGHGGGLSHMPQGGTGVGIRGGGSGAGPAAAGVAAAAFAAPPPLTIPESPSDGGSGGGVDTPGQGQQGWEGREAAGGGGTGATGPSGGVLG